MYRNFYIYNCSGREKIFRVFFFCALARDALKCKRAQINTQEVKRYLLNGANPNIIKNKVSCGL